MENHFLNVILYLILFETRVINQIKGIVVCFFMAMLEVVTTFSAFNKLVFILFLFNLRGHYQVGVSENI